MAANNESKLENIQKVRACFYDGKIWTKNKIATQTNLSLALTTNILGELLEDNEIIYIGDADSTGGRKSKRYILNENYSHIGMINLTKDHLKYVMKLSSFNLNEEKIFEVTNEDDQGNLQSLMQCTKILLEKDPLIEVIIISLPGVCVNGVVDLCDYQNLEGENIVDCLSIISNRKVIVENDVNIACIGFSYEHPNVKQLAFMYQPSQDYVGCGIVLNGSLYNGFSHFAGELRYLPCYDSQSQDEMLIHDPEGLLMDQIVSLTAVLNPQMVGYHSDCFTSFKKKITDYGIPSKHCPILVEVKDLDGEIEKGLFSIGLKNIKEKNV